MAVQVLSCHQGHSKAESTATVKQENTVVISRRVEMEFFMREVGDQDLLEVGGHRQSQQPIGIGIEAKDKTDELGHVHAHGGSRGWSTIVAMMLGYRSLDHHQNKQQIHVDKTYQEPVLNALSTWLCPLFLHLLLNPCFSACMTILTLNVTANDLDGDSGKMSGVAVLKDADNISWQHVRAGWRAAASIWAKKSRNVDPPRSYAHALADGVSTLGPVHIFAPLLQVPQVLPFSFIARDWQEKAAKPGLLGTRVIHSKPGLEDVQQAGKNEGVCSVAGAECIVGRISVPNAVFTEVEHDSGKMIVVDMQGKDELEVEVTPMDVIAKTLQVHELAWIITVKARPVNHEK
ncbi:hypothetical protein CONPUDRAFT_71619 [Coniophora puteana RWD-64-598 SS2]|uniref:Uncharacterized protein n=1 Tax=Coniophora puteana (strain RWD-64-598) TaxID=741705 RepID=A0A5M3MUW0_CONPW|nr:uncharacterized protein CONPUDRAFT_71619 [Coniophora puteana RWD-64-598 SS2]EIW82962.1 hypothetical protein CONPUDRAFT_71619 [Coniophora puteana RWD-64-598 SS2]